MEAPVRHHCSYWWTGQCPETVRIDNKKAYKEAMDYKIAHDLMPFTWIQECLKLYKINRFKRVFIKNVMVI